MQHTSKPVILIFIDWYLPGYKAGGPIQSCANMVHQLGHAFDFRIVTRNTDYCSTDVYTEINSNAWNELPFGEKVYYLSADQITYRNIKQLIKTVNPNVVYLNGIFSLHFTLMPLRAAKKLNIKSIVIASRGMLAPEALQVKAAKKKLFLATAKYLGMYDRILFHASNQTELKQIKKQLGPFTPVKIASNLPQAVPAASTLESIPKLPQTLKLVSIARIAPEKNTLQALQILVDWSARFTDTNQHVCFDLYGPIYNDSYWEACQALISKLPTWLEVNYKGPLPAHQVGKVLQQYHFLYLPTKGENFGHILLQSFMHARPVLTSDQTPWTGLAMQQAGWDLPLHQVARFYHALDECLAMDADTYQQLSKGARMVAEKYCNNPTVWEDNKQLFV